VALRLYNTLTRTVKEFHPLKAGEVSMYVCGPTVYDDPHIGHVRSAYVFDVLRRYLSQQYTVKFVRNVTDVDDKIIEKARQEIQTRDPKHETRDLKATCEEVAQRYLARYHEALGRLGLAQPTQEPRATAHIDEMINLISQLVVNGSAYEAEGGDVYFAVRKFERYGQLSNRSLDELQAGARVEPGEEKRDPLDFALWKSAKPDEPSWQSPWGQGRPGWHIECSAMSTKYLEPEFDLHGGGLDLIFPHHENEIAQAQAAGQPFARYWLHHGLLTVNGEKMSKSLGNFITVDAVLKEFSHPDYLKIFFLKTHYRSPIDYSRDKMEESKKNYGEFQWFLEHYDQLAVRPKPGTQLEMTEPNFQGAFQKAMDDDLNTPQAMAVLFELVKRGREGLERHTVEGSAVASSCWLHLVELGMKLGLFTEGVGETPPHIKALVSERIEARKAKQYEKADTIREKVQEEGFLLTDTSQGTLIRRAR